MSKSIELSPRLLAGEPLNLKIPVDGEPPPSKEWTKDGNKVEDGIHLSLFNESYKTTIRISESRRSDSGVYELYAKNVNGTDRCAWLPDVYGQIFRTYV